MREKRIKPAGAGDQAVVLTDEVIDRVDSHPRGGYLGLDRYMRELRRWRPVIDKVEFDCLIKRWRECDDGAAYETLVYGNARLVMFVAMRLCKSTLSLLDRLQEGFIGLMTALDRYDPNLGFKFSTMAIWWIKQAIGRAGQNAGERWAFRVPVHAQEKVNFVGRLVSTLYARNGRWPEDHEVHELAHQTDDTANEHYIGRKLTMAEIARCRRLAGDHHRSLDEQIGTPDEDQVATLGGLVADEQDDPLTQVEARRLLFEYHAALKRVEAELNLLPARQAMIIRLRYGLGNFDRQTLEEVGQRYGITRERVRQIETVALARLKEQLGIDSQELADMVASFDRLTNITSAVPVEASPDKAVVLPEPLSLERYMQVLGEHAIARPDGRCIVPVPVKVLRIRTGLKALTSRQLLEQLRTLGRLDGGAPWSYVTITRTRAI